MYAYRTLKVEIPWRLVEERPDVLDPAVRMEEGAELKLAFLGVEKRGGEKDPTYGGLYVALVFAREVTPVEPRALVVVNVNRLDHYVKVGLVADGRRGREDGGS